MMGSRKSIRSDLGKVLGGNLGTQILGIVRGLVVPLVVSPTQFGLWRVILLVWQYGQYLHLGSFELLNREIPGLIATGERERLSRVRRISFWSTMALASLAGLAAVAFTFTPAAGGDPEQIWALRIIAFGLVAQPVMTYVRLDHRAHSRFGRMSLLGLSHGACAIAMMIPLAWVAGVPGLAAGLVFATVLVAVAFGRRDAFEPPGLYPRAFLRQVAQGIPLSSVSFLNTAIVSVGQIVSASILGLEAAGFYGLGMMIGTLVYAIPRATGKVLYPRYLASYSRARDSRESGHLIRRSIQISSITSTLAVCGAAIVLEPVFTYVFPEYAPALPATYALIAMMPFLAQVLVLQSALLAFRLHRQIIGLQIFFVVISAALSLVGAIVFRDVVWVALGIMASTIAYGLSAMWLTLAATGAGDRSPAREMLSALLPILVLGTPTVAMLALWRPSGTQHSSILVSAMQLLAIAPIAAFYGLRLWHAARGAGTLPAGRKPRPG